MELCSRGERLDQLWIQQENVGIYSQCTGRGAVEEASKVMGDSFQTGLIRLLLKADQGGWISPGGWRGLRNLVNYPGWSYMECWLSRVLVELGCLRTHPQMEPSWNRPQRSLSLVKERIFVSSFRLKSQVTYSGRCCGQWLALHWKTIFPSKGRLNSSVAKNTDTWCLDLKLYSSSN